jgi:hypothetical protein
MVEKTDVLMSAPGAQGGEMRKRALNRSSVQAGCIIPDGAKSCQPIRDKLINRNGWVIRRNYLNIWLVENGEFLE